MSGTLANAENIKIQPVQVIFGNYQKQTITCAADVAGSHAGDYLKIFSAKDAVEYNFWFKVSGTGSAPSASGTEVEVDITTGATAAQVATALGAKIEDTVGFKVNVTGADVEVTCTQPGAATAAVTVAGLTGFTYATDVAGSDSNMGYSDGDIEVKFDEKLLDITAHQTGSDIITSLRQGKITEVTVAMKETDLDNLKIIFGGAGTVWTPTGGNEVVSWGTNTNSENIIAKAGKLVLHPVKNGEYFGSSPDVTEDLAFWKAYLKPEGIKFSGENPKIANVTFKIYTDDTKDTRGNLWVLGDHTKNFDADEQS